MPPRRSKRLSSTAEEASEETAHSMPLNVEYFEIDAEDLNRRATKENDLVVESGENERKSNASSPEYSEYFLSRKVRLLIRRTHLMAALISMRLLMSRIQKSPECMALSVSIVPRHILRVFDSSMVNEGKSLKNSLSMLATWWKNNFGLRMLPETAKTPIITAKTLLRNFSKLKELKLALQSKAAYEDDSVVLFATMCLGLGVKVRWVQSLGLTSASTAKRKSDGGSFQYVPSHWIEFYSFFEERWVPIDCIQGFVDEKTKLESKSRPHSFVMAVDSEGTIFDLTRKYALEYDEKSFRLRKDEDKWLEALINYLNPHPNKMASLARLPDLDSTKSQRNCPQPIEVPKTLSAMKSHPLLILASQVRKYEVFFPVIEPVGYFKEEPVYLRENVQKVRSKDAWFSQCARIVKEGEEPIKLVSLPRKAGAPESEPTGVQPLFGEWQTDPYVPPEIIDGKVPKNEHGSVDLFQPSMLPKGCVHVTLPGALKVARHLRIDYADACIGFSFHGGRALPLVSGIVLTEENYSNFQHEYNRALVESYKNDAAELERHIAQKWVKIIKNALIARRLKQDSLASVSDSLISVNQVKVGGHDGASLESMGSSVSDENYISAFSSTHASTAKEPEIEEFDAI